MEYNNLKAKYKTLLELISEKISSSKDKKFILNNINSLANKFIKLSKLINNINNTIRNNQLSYNQKLNKINYKNKFAI